MTSEEKIAVFKQVDLLSFYDDSSLEKLAEHCREIHLKANDLLFKEGSRENAMYLIVSGTLGISKGTKNIAELAPGQYLGEMSLIEAKPRSASAKALKNSLVLEITEETFHTYLASQPQALLDMMRTLSSRIRNDLDNMMTEMLKLSIFAHDIKNNISPLHLAENALEHLVESFSGAKSGHKKREGLDDLENCFDAMKIVRENLMTLLDASLNHVKRVQVPYRKFSTPIIPLVQETIRGISCHTNLSGKNITVETMEDIPDAKINTLDIKRVLQNLIINAGCVTGDNGNIKVRLQKCSADIQISVIDQGCGIPEEVRPFLFKEVLTTKEDGNGLGLLSCKAIIEESHQGKLWFNSEVGKGTAFHFTLPISANGV